VGFQEGTKLYPGSFRSISRLASTYALVLMVIFSKVSSSKNIQKISPGPSSDWSSFSDLAGTHAFPLWVGNGL